MFLGQIQQNTVKKHCKKQQNTVKFNNSLFKNNNISPTKTNRSPLGRRCPRPAQTVALRFAAFVALSGIGRSGTAWFGGLPRPPKVPCFLEVFCYIKPTKKHSFGYYYYRFTRSQFYFHLSLFYCKLSCLGAYRLVLWVFGAWAFCLGPLFLFFVFPLWLLHGFCGFAKDAAW